MEHKHSDFFLILILNVFFFLLLSFMYTAVIHSLPDPLPLFLPSLLWIAFNSIIMYLFALHVPLYFQKMHGYSIVLAFAFSIPFAGLFVLLKEPFPVYAGLVFAFLDAALTSIAEEYSFRGIIATISEQTYGIRFAFFFQALFFMIFHFHFTIGFIIAYLAFSFAAYWLYFWQKDRNILYPIIFHALTNFWMYLIYLQ